ncbi:hypothetical protein [Methylocucumis oryzae]|uniref:Uncharacterized protein n=1 Tax=Methylocucumis oryzae TaxID=1632867 RepID=A0A0F3IQJ8_9GAMM|nr:hypothetical protein [Methylocucumis oryzae]KJV07859.1 hypothetical protein VZ94_02075 [Methylocucumis oryzae]
MPVSTIRKITQHHSEQMHTQKPSMTLPLAKPGCQQQIGELDGTMIPIANLSKVEGDKRKQIALID